MSTTSTVPARHDHGPSGLRTRGRFPRGASRRSGRGGSPLDFRKVVRGIGKTLIACGVLIFLFVAYELWGTGFAQRRDQKALKNQFNKVTTPTTVGSAAPPDTVAAPADGAIGVIQIPNIGVDQAVVEGVGVEDLKKGPGHYPGTPLPGEAGNSAIAGHRTTYGAPFNRLDELKNGDPITVRTRAGTFRYEVSSSKVVSPSEVSVLAPTPDNRLTLTTCNPKYSAAQRLIIVAALIGPAAPPVEAPIGGPAAPPSDGTALAGLSGKAAPKGPAIAWGLLAAAIWFLAWAAGHWWRRWPAYLLATPVFLIVLFVFFENFSRLLPANV
jgi:sortase A